MQITGTFIIARQYVGKTGNGTVTFFDLDTGRQFTCTWQGGQLSDKAAADRTPRRLILDAVEYRDSDRGGYLTCAAIYDAAAVAPTSASGGKSS